MHGYFKMMYIVHKYHPQVLKWSYDRTRELLSTIEELQPVVHDVVIVLFDVNC